MSLFDVIRYPITDIFDQVEMERIPREISISWLEECYNLVGDKDADPANLKNTAASATWIHILVIWSVFEHNEPQKSEHARILKEHFTALLRERIEKHE